MNSLHTRIHTYIHMWNCIGNIVGVKMLLLQRVFVVTIVIVCVASLSKPLPQSLLKRRVCMCAPMWVHIRVYVRVCVCAFTCY